jgi:hypothetical protein
MDLKKVGVVVALVVVIVIAAIFTAHRTKSTTENAAVQSAEKNLTDVAVEKIDNKTYEVISETAADWAGKYAPDSSGHWKNPKTGEYTVCNVITCASCGVKIPVPDFPPVTGKGQARVEAIGQMMQIKRDYMCPKCGKQAYAESELKGGRQP